MRLHRGHPSTVEHRISLLLDVLADADPWRARLDPLDRFSQFATSYRYPSPSGKLKRAPDAAAIEAGRQELAALLALAVAELKDA